MVVYGLRLHASGSICDDIESRRVATVTGELAATSIGQHQRRANVQSGRLDDDPGHRLDHIIVRWLY